MNSDRDLFEVEIYCALCGSDEVEVYYDAEEKCLVYECDCGNRDFLFVEEI